MTILRWMCWRGEFTHTFEQRIARFAGCLPTAYFLFTAAPEHLGIYTAAAADSTSRGGGAGNDKRGVKIDGCLDRPAGFGLAAPGRIGHTARCPAFVAACLALRHGEEGGPGWFGGGIDSPAALGGAFAAEFIRVFPCPGLA